ncbi:adenosine deaminase-like protein [Copidosoma floridanum]|uniref:adenosine deaminase-like protein n=1 Tax=Copidosoma floridanum TaxID=29053 RepID=UPI0006C97DB5|nr:adenosine deaminase-like protein [Copidosoma floridanum]
MSATKIKSSNESKMKNFCHNLPKIELHAHLNGSLSCQTLTKLFNMKHARDTNHENFDVEKCNSLTEIFDVFSLAYSVTETPEAVYTATYDTIKEFYEDNVIYLELRSTPRACEKMTKKEYILAITQAIKDCKKSNLSIKVKLLISVNRKQGFKAAKENIRLAIEMKQEHDCIVGIDLSGDPTKGEAFIELLHIARTAGLKIAAHCAEVPNEVESMDIIKFKPDRLGHGTCIHPLSNGSEELYETFLSSKIPVELCLSSNIMCKTVPTYDAHHFKYLYESKHPLCICTDDKGVFNTTLSKELILVMKYFNLSENDLIKLMKSTASYAFASCIEKNELIEIIDGFSKSAENTVKVTKNFK